MTKGQQTVRRGHEALRLGVVLDDSGSPRLPHLGLPGEAESPPLRPCPWWR